MRVVVPYVQGMLQEATVMALEQDRQQAEYWDVSASPFEYFYMLKRVWESGESFVVVEEDVVVYPGAIAAMIGCEHAWCATEYLTCGVFQYGLGCTKFSDEIIRNAPDAFERMAAGIDFRSAHGDPRHFQHLDAQLALVLSRLLDIAWPHRHRPPVTHLNPSHFYPAGVRP